MLGCRCDAIIHSNFSRYGDVAGDDAHDILQFLTGLDASAGSVIICSEDHVHGLQHSIAAKIDPYGDGRKSALFVDGRYELAAKNCIDTKNFDVLPLGNAQMITWIQKNLPSKCTIAYDPRFFPINRIKFIYAKLPGCEFLRIDLAALLSLPEMRQRKMQLHDTYNIYCADGEHEFRQSERLRRLGYIFEEMNQHKLDAYLLCNSCTIAWILGIRDFGIAFTPVPLCHLLITAARDFTLYIDDDYENASGELEEMGIKNVKYQADLPDDLPQYPRLGIDESEAASHLMGKNLVAVANPCQLPQSIKDAFELEQIRISSRKDSAAIIKFLKWIYDETEADHPVTEMQASRQMLEFRKMQEGFVGESFRCIAAADDNAAIVHYMPHRETDRIIKNILLLDSGGQYKYGTTDITRTLALADTTEEQQLFYTLVLKGHIALATAKFPLGTTGAQLDILARQFLHHHCADYKHSTGHGIGYLLNVHEGPAAIAANSDVPLAAGMLLSNEPGYYRENEFGIRLENMMLVQRENDDFLSFEMISWVPFDWRFIDEKLLTDSEISWMLAYQDMILSQTRDYLAPGVAEWLTNFLRSHMHKFNTSFI
jgi:Xaa-Pro aminopeptidase